MNLLSREELKEMTAREQGLCVSIFMPTHKAGADTQQDPVRLKNLCRDAQKTLHDQGLRNDEIEKLMKPVHSLIQDDSFWPHQSDGLAVFVAQDFFRYYRVPIGLEELVHVGERFVITPMMPLLVGDEPFFLLAISQNEVRFLQCTRFSCRELEVPGVPQSQAEALQWDDPEYQHQQHSVGSASGPGVMHHGQGVGIDDEKDNLLRYFRLVDAGLKSLLASQSAPLILACVDYYVSIYEAANTYHNLLKEHVSGNPEHVRGDELHARAWEVLKPQAEAAREAAAERYRALSSNGRSSRKLEEVIGAASSGRVETLFTASGEHVWGKYDPATGLAEHSDNGSEGQDDLLNIAAIQTFLNGGTVYTVPRDLMPDHGPLAAVFRY